MPDHHLLIVGINYAPEPTGIGPYTTAVAERLAEDNEVTVLTGLPHYPRWRVDADRRSAMVAEERHGRVRVIRCAHYVPGRQTAVRRALYEASFLLTGLLGSWRVRGADAVIGVVPSLSGAVLARLCARRLRAPYGILFQDLVGQASMQSGISGGRAAAKVATRVEGWAARGAAANAIIAEPFAGYLERLGVERRRIIHAPNWTRVAPPTADRESVRARHGWKAEETVVLHAGNMGLKQGLEQVVEAARIAAAERLTGVRFVFVGDGNQRRALEDSARGLANLAFLGFVAEDEFSNLLAASDVLLVSERATAENMSLPSKLTSYFAAGRPVVAAVPPDGTTAREVERSGAGEVVPAGDARGLLAAVMRIGQDPARSAELGAAGARYAASALSAEPGLQRIDEFVAAVLQEGPA